MLWCEAHLLIDRNASLSRSLSVTLSVSHLHTGGVRLVPLSTQRFSLLLRLPLHLPYIHLYFWVLYTEPYPCAYNSHWTSTTLSPYLDIHREQWNVLYGAHIKTNPNTGYIKPFWESKRLKHAKKYPTQNTNVRFNRGHLRYFWFCFCFRFFLFISYILQFKVNKYVEQRQCVRESFFFHICPLSVCLLCTKKCVHV